MTIPLKVLGLENLSLALAGYVVLKATAPLLISAQNNCVINLDEGELLLCRVKCQVEHAMPIVLGTGNFGQVYQGEIEFEDGTRTSVAVKRLNGNLLHFSYVFPSILFKLNYYWYWLRIYLSIHHEIATKALQPAHLGVIVHLPTAMR